MKTRNVGIAAIFAVVMMLTANGCALLQVQSRMENGIWREHPGAEIERLNWLTGSSKIKLQGTREQRQVLLDFSGTIIDEACSQNCSSPVRRQSSAAPAAE